MNKEIIAYSFCARRPLSDMRDEDIRMLTGVNISFGYCKEDFSINIDHLGDLSCVKRFKEINPAIKVMISLGGAGSGGWSNACLTRKGRQRIVSSTMDFILKWGLDGVDLDWEFPAFPLRKEARPEDKYTYTQLCESFRAALDEQGKKDSKRYWLTMASGADIYMLDSIEVKRIGEILDYILIMTYDMRHQWKFRFESEQVPVTLSGHHTNLYPTLGDPYGISIERSVELFKTWGVPAEKLIIGCAHYAKKWAEVEDVNHGLTQPGVGETSIGGYGKLLEETLGNGDYEEYWDEAACAPYLYSKAEKTFVTYDNPRSIKEKAKYVKAEGLAGLMFWEYFGDTSHTLVPAYYEELNQ